VNQAVTLAFFLAAVPWPDREADDSAELASADPARRLAAVVRIGAVGAPDGLRRIGPFLDAGGEGGSAALRLAAARALARAGDAAALARITAWAADRRSSMRTEALALLRDAPALPAETLRVAERALGDADPAVKLLALALLAAHPQKQSATAVAGLLGDGNRDVRVAAARLLGASGEARALVPLLERIDDSDRQVRIAVVGALGDLGDGRAGPALARQLADGDGEIRAAAIEAVARVRWRPAVPALAEMARARNADLQSRRAVLALGAIGDGPAVEALVELLQAPPLSDEVVEALRRSGPAAVPALTTALESALPGGAATAAAVLGASGDRRATGALATTVARRPLVAVAAAAALGRLGDPDAVLPLTLTVERRPPAAAPVRAACLRALAALGDDRAAAAVEAAARDPDPEVRDAALRLAAAVRGGLGRATLAERLADGDPSVRRAAVAAAAVLPALRPAAALLDAVVLRRGPEPSDGGDAGPHAAPTTETDRQAAAAALERIVDEADRPRLIDALARARPGTRWPVLRALAAVPPAGPAAAPIERALLEALATGDRTAAAAAEVLGAWPLGRDTVRALTERLQALPPDLRARLCPALARAATPETDRALAALIDGDPDDAVRAAAAWSSAPRRGQRAITAALERARRSPVEAVSGNAASVASGAAPAGATPDRSSWLRLRVRTADGAPAAAAWLRVRTGSLAVWVRTDRSGEARLGGLPPGPYTVTAPEGVLARHALEAEASDGSVQPRGPQLR
jgi:HEAT repeat protein